MTMSDRQDPSALRKRINALEEQADEAQRSIAELRSRDALKTQFLSNISHDLRTPLAAIITHAEILRDAMLGELNPKQKESVIGIVTGGQHLLNMIDEILTYVRTASDKVSLVRTEFSLADLADQVRMLNQPLAAKNHISIERLSGDDLPPVYADRDKIQHVLGNLIGNAIKFTNDGGRVWIAFSRRGRDGEEICVEVGSPPATTSWCSTNSPRSMRRRRVRITAPVSGWRSRASSSSCTRGGSGSRVSSAKEAGSSLRYRSSPPAISAPLRAHSHRGRQSAGG